MMTSSSQLTDAASGCSTTSLPRAIRRFDSAAGSAPVHAGRGQSHSLSRRISSQGNAGKNPPAGAVIDYWLKTSLKKSDKDNEKDKQEASASSGTVSIAAEADKGTTEADEAKAERQTQKRRKKKKPRKSPWKFWIPPGKSSASIPRKKSRRRRRGRSFGRDRAARPICLPMPD